MAVGVSILITSAPVLAFSAAASGQVTLDLTGLGTGADGVVVYSRNAATGTWTAQTQRTATGTFSITGLTDGVLYDFLAVPYDSSDNIGSISNTIRVRLTGGSAVFGTQEVLETFEDILASLNWPGSANSIFGQSVIILADASVLRDALAHVIPPAVLIYDNGEAGSICDETPLFAVQRVGFTIVARNDGDKYGTKALLGGQRASDSVSQGAGLLALHSAVIRQFDAVLQNGTYPFRFLTRYVSATKNERVDNTNNVAMRNYTYLLQIKE